MNKKENKKSMMKATKILTLVLGIILVSMISFVGIYTQNANQIKNSVKDYSYAMDLDGARTIKFSVNTDTEEVIKDSQGNIIEEATEEEIAENGYTKEEVETNGEDIRTVENYKKSKEVIEKRLKKLGVENYIISLNKENGEILLEIPEDSKTDEVLTNLRTTGKLEISDSETGEVLINNNDIKSSSVLYSSTSNGTSVYLEIAFNKDGKKKIEDISKTYVTVDDTKATTTEDTEEDNITGNETEEITEDTSTEKTTQKQITMKIDDTEIMTTSFKEPITTGKIQLSVGTATTDSATLQDYVTQAQEIATVLDSGNIPIKYDINKNEYILSSIEKQDLLKIIIGVSVIAIIGIVVIIAKYKTNGLLAGISYIGLVAVYMILIRYANVIISVQSIFGIIVVLALNYIFTHTLLNNIEIMKKEKVENKVNKATSKAYSKFFTRIIPICIMVVAFCFIKWTPISSFGMVAFWGLALITVYNVAITRTLLKIQVEDK